MFFFIGFPAVIYAGPDEEQILQWNEPLDKADLLLFSSHADDEHLFFAGILPYCAANGITAQVVYMTNHNDNPIRNTELLNGLWAVGIRNYPVISIFPDLFSESLEDALRVYKNRGFSEDDFTAFCVSNVRRFKPQVAVGHDINGEYGHGTHRLSAAALMKAVVFAGDSNYHSESFAEYGVWDTPKTYLHLWNDRPIVLSINEPLSFFDGKTAFQVSQYGFSYHKSQHWTWFYRWLNGTAQAPITSSTQIRSYSPGKFGLYRTLVGDDSQDVVDFFENVTLIKDIIKETPSASQLQGEAAEAANGDAAGFGEQEIIKFRQQYLKLITIAIFIVITAALIIFLIKKLKRK